MDRMETRINESSIVPKMKSVFGDWDESSLDDLVDIANGSGRYYGDKTELKSQFTVLKERYNETRAKDEMSKWLMMFTKENLYKDIPLILHFALCCFSKPPLEATAETIGSVIKQHGRQQRYSLLPSSLSNEIQVAWNGPEEFDPVTNDIIEEAVDSYFIENKYGVRFYKTTQIKLISETLRSYMSIKSRIKF